MARFPDLPLEKMDAHQRAVHDKIASGPRGRVRGPLQVWLLSSEMAERAQHLGEFLRYKTSLGPRLSELAILVTARHYSSPFEWWVHAPIGIQQGLDPGMVEAIRTRRKPKFVKDDEAVVYDFSSEMHEKHKVSQATFDRAVKLFGNKGVTELGGILGYYVLAAISLSTYEMEPPEPVFDD